MRTALKAGALGALVSSCLALPMAVSAGPSDYVISPIVEEGEKEIDFKAGSRKLRDDRRESAYSIGFGWGATSWWFTELYAIWHKPPDEKHGFDAWEWENKFQLTETGKYPLDVGFLLEVERPKERSEGHELRWGPLLQTEFGGGRLQVNLNLLLEKHVRAEQPSNTELGYQWQIKYRWKPRFEVGLQGFGEVGPWRDWAPASEQSHIVGPALFGRVRVGDHQHVKYNIGLLFAANQAAPRKTLRLQAEYEF